MLLHLVHIAALANFAYSLYFDIYVVNLPASAPRHNVSYAGARSDDNSWV